MVVSDRLVATRDNVIKRAGTQIRVRYYDIVFDDVYDEATELTQSGTDLWTSGVVLPIADSSTDSLQMPQGKLIDSDMRLYVNGSLQFAGSLQNVDIQVGSPTGDLFTTIPDGGIRYETEGVAVYRKQFIRRLTGSLI